MQELTEEEIVQDYYGLVVHLAKPYMRNYEYDDLISEGLTAVLIAFRRYDPSAGASLDTYIGQRVKFELGRYVRKSKSGFHVPHETERVLRLIRKEKLLNCTPEEISEKLDVAKNLVEYALLAYKRGKVISSDVLVSDGEGKEQSVGDLVRHHDDKTAMYVEDFLRRLTVRERYILRRIYEGAGQPQIARELNTYQMKISRELKVIKDKYTEWERIS